MNPEQAEKDLANFNLYDYVLGERTGISPKTVVSEKLIHFLATPDIRMYPSDEDEPPWIKELVEFYHKKRDEHVKLEMERKQKETAIAAIASSGGVTCKICKESFETEDILKTHLIRQHKISMIQNSSVRNATGGGVFTPEENVCVHCQKGFRNLADYISHSSLSSKLECVFCSDEYSCLGAWSTHLMKVHVAFVYTIDQYSCVKCPTKLSTRHNLVSHYATHLSNQNYHCPLCNSKTYKTVKGLSNHLKVHGEGMLQQYQAEQQLKNK